MEIDLSDFRKPLVVGGLILSAITGAALVWNTNVHRIPDLENREDRQDQALTARFAEMNKNLGEQFAGLRNDLSGMDGRYRERLNKMDLTVSGLKVNIARLCWYKRPRTKICTPEAVVADVKNATQAQAQFFDSAKVTLTDGLSPSVMTPGLKELLPVYVRTDAYGQPTGKKELADMILWSSAADSAHWRQEGNTVKADFANGAAIFMLGNSATKEETQALVDSLNATVEALKASEGAEKKSGPP